MKGLRSIGSAVVLSVMISGIVLGQQSSSAVQVVTFGVSRAPQMIAKSFASVRNTKDISSNLASETFKTRLAKSALKVTLSSNTSDADGSLGKESPVGHNGLASASASIANGKSENRGIVQKDLLSFNAVNSSSSLHVASVLLTITE